jgi:antitoxin MazE
MVLATVTKWGNSLGIRIPQSMAAQLGVTENSSVSLELDGNRLIVVRGQTLDEMLALVTDENKHELVDFGAPRGKELI